MLGVVFPATTLHRLQLKPAALGVSHIGKEF